jgi:hypothetical protein
MAQKVVKFNENDNINTYIGSVGQDQFGMLLCQQGTKVSTAP